MTWANAKLFWSKQFSQFGAKLEKDPATVSATVGGGVTLSVCAVLWLFSTAAQGRSRKRNDAAAPPDFPQEPS